MSLHHWCWYQLSGCDENKYEIIIMCLLVFEFYLQFLGAKAVKDVNPLRGESELAKVIVEYQVQVILMFSKTAHHLQSHNNQITRICWKPSRVFQRTSRFCQVKRNSEKKIVLDPEMVFFQWCYKIQLCSPQKNFRTAWIWFAFITRDFQKIFSCRRLWGHLKFTKIDITGAAVSSIDL